MIDENNTDEDERFTEDSNDKVTQEAPALSLVINGQYTKDLSFEAPNTPEVFNLLQSEMPNIQVDIDVQGNAKDQNVFEVVLKVRAEAKVKEELAYICELSYAGIFTISVPVENIGPVLLIDCPLILFPFLRRIVADVTSDGGFAPLMLTPVDFASLYQKRILHNQDKDTPPPN
ncbi:MAG: protein-export chaperone SecB [Rhodospirillales bacterium]|nr:protein-export chaperone SecB [Rhodospirillales bacterium]